MPRHKALCPWNGYKDETKQTAACTCAIPKNYHVDLKIRDSGESLGRHSFATRKQRCGYCLRVMRKTDVWLDIFEWESGPAFNGERGHA